MGDRKPTREEIANMTDEQWWRYYQANEKVGQTNRMAVAGISSTNDPWLGKWKEMGGKEDKVDGKTNSGVVVEYAKQRVKGGWKPKKKKGGIKPWDTRTW